MSYSGAGCPEAWLAARLVAGLPAERWTPVPLIGGCAFSGYEVSDCGNGRSLDRERNGRMLYGRPVRTRLHKDGYILADFMCDDPATCKKRKNPGKHTFTMHKVVLAAFDKPRPPGMQGSHLSGNPSWNWFPEGLAWEDQPANERRKPPEVRRAAAHKAFAARTGYLPSPQPAAPGWRDRLAATLRYRSRGEPVTRPVTNAQRMTGKPIRKSKATRMQDRYHPAFDSLELTCDDRCRAA